MATHNGPGIRTMVHFKGCNLRCVWCSTPESQSCAPQISYSEQKCIGCGACVPVCPESCMELGTDHKIRIDWDLCTNCCKCAAGCCSTALEVVGRKYTAEELYREILRDQNLYRRSGGGVTFSGGEPLLQADDEMLHLLKLLKTEDVSIGFDTAGAVAAEVIDRILPFTDFFLWDVKTLDADLHQKATGLDNRQILENLHDADEKGVALYLRCPVIPGINDREDYFRGLAALAGELKHVKEIHLFPLHHLGSSRYKKIGRVDLYENVKPVSQEYMLKQKRYLEACGFQVKIIGI